jgi:uncharacterized protein YdeI (YjbR/CyaY-like superfamily)
MSPEPGRPPEPGVEPGAAPGMPRESEHPDGRLRIHPESRGELRAWLAANHDRGAGVWLVQWKRSSGRPRVGYEDVVEELLCFGWIDSTAGAREDEVESILVTPRKRGSNWAKSNKGRIERLEAAGLMTDAGRRPIEAAKADGSWTRLDDAEAFVVAPDLAAAFDAHPGSREQWDAFPPFIRKMHLSWIAAAKTAPTRERRLEEIASKAELGIRALQPAAQPRTRTDGEG